MKFKDAQFSSSAKISFCAKWKIICFLEAQLGFESICRKVFALGKFYNLVENSHTSLKISLDSLSNVSKNRENVP